MLTVERGVETSELQVGAVPQSVDQSGHDGRRLEAVVEAFVYVEVVLQLGRIVTALCVGAVVVTDGREDRHASDGEAVRLEEAGIPVVVLSPALLIHAS